MTTLALDHLTVADTTPSQLVTVAAEAGYRAVCMFFEPMDVLPRMPHFALIGATPERRATRQRCLDLGVSIDLAYPFTLAGRTEVAAFQPAMETAAWLGARTLNVLIYDRDATRRADKFASFCELAAQYGLLIAVEFYRLSQVRSLGEALDLAGPIGRPGAVGVNVDLLHLIRSGGEPAQLGEVPPGSILYAQFCDGERTQPQDRWAWEASSQRLLPGEGAFPVGEFARTLPPGVPCSVEVPQESGIDAGIPVLLRASRALEATRRAIEPEVTPTPPTS